MLELFGGLQSLGLSGGPSNAQTSAGDWGAPINFVGQGGTASSGFDWLRDLVLPVAAGLAVIWLAKRVL